MERYLDDHDVDVLQRKLNKVQRLRQIKSAPQRRRRNAPSKASKGLTYQLIRGTAYATTNATSKYVVLIGSSIVPFEEKARKPSDDNVNVAIPPDTIINSGDTVWAAYHKKIVTIEASGPDPEIVIDWYKLPTGTGGSPPLRWFEIQATKNSTDSNSIIKWVNDDGTLGVEDIVYDPYLIFNGQVKGITATAIRGCRGIALLRADLKGVQEPRWEIIGLEGYTKWVICEYMAGDSGLLDDRKLSNWYRFTGMYNSKDQWSKNVPADSGDPVRFQASDLVVPQVGDYVLMELLDPDALLVPAGGFTWQPKYIPVAIKERFRTIKGTLYSGSGASIIVTNVVPLNGGPDPTLGDSTQHVTVAVLNGATFSSGDIVVADWNNVTKQWEARPNQKDRLVAASPAATIGKTLIENLAPTGTYDPNYDALAAAEAYDAGGGNIQVRVFVPNLYASGGGYTNGCGISLSQGRFSINYTTLAGTGLFVNPLDLETGRICPKLDVDVIGTGIVYQRADTASFDGTLVVPGRGLVRVFRPQLHNRLVFDVFQTPDPVEFFNWSQETTIEVGDQVFLGLTVENQLFAVKITSNDWRYIQTTVSIDKATFLDQVSFIPYIFQAEYYEFDPLNGYTLALDPNDNTTPLTIPVEWGDFTEEIAGGSLYFGRASRSANGKWSTDWMICTARTST